jgi:predicted glutamine amidotransferase
MLMSDLLQKAEQSLIRQSFKARERKEPLNGDGFGVGWYVPEIDPIPCVFTSTTPAWSNRNLHRLAEKIRSSCFFAHVRAASPGAFVSEFNCHPYQYEQFLWMHNGAIADFPAIKRRLRESLQDDYYGFIQGTTDSEHAFAVFMNKLGDRIEDYSMEDLREAMSATIRQIHQWQQEAGIDQPSYLNFAVTDGISVVVSRYVTSPDAEPPTLYIALGEDFEIIDGKYRMTPATHHPRAIIIASEPVTEERADWKAIERNSLVTVTPELHVHITPID